MVEELADDDEAHVDPEKEYVVAKSSSAARHRTSCGSLLSTSATAL